MVVPTLPIPNLVVRQARFALSTLNTLLDAMFRLGYPAELGEFRVRAGVGQVVVGLHYLLIVTILVANHHHHFLVPRSSFIRPCDNTSPHHFNPQRSFSAVSHVDLLVLP